MRCVIHVDLDAFYAQVEQLRTGTDPAIPLAVQQWSAVTAVNYPARAHGITRHLTTAECMQRCPDLQLVHVATMSIDSVRVDIAEDTTGIIKSYGAKCGVHVVDNRRCKASLEPYRRASKDIFASIREFFTIITSQGYEVEAEKEQVVIEKASVDEAFIEVPLWLLSTIPEGPPVGVPIVAEYDVIEGEQNTVIAKGTKVAENLRKHIQCKLGYTMSAGIAKNKTLAKIASAKNKPDNQTFVFEEHVEPLMRVTPFSKIRFLGGKLGNLLRSGAGGDGSDGEFDEEGDVQYWTFNKHSEPDPSAFELQQLSIEELTVKTGDRQSAEWIYNVIRGEDDSTVIDRSLVKSFMSAKQHRPPLSDHHVLLQWLRLFAVELSVRVMCEFEETKRWPHTATLHYRKPHQNGKSKTTPLPLRHLQLTPQLLYQHILKQLLMKIPDGILPVNMVGVSVGRFMAVSVSAGKAMDEFVLLQSKTNATEGVLLFKPQLPTLDTKASQETTWRCTRCSKWYSHHELDKIQEHKDHHMAMDLARLM